MNLGECYNLRCRCQTCGGVQDCRITDLTSGSAVCRGLIRPDGIIQPCPGKLQPSEESQDATNNALALLAYAIGAAGFLDSGQKHTLLQRLREMETSVGTAQTAQTVRAIAEDLVRVIDRAS
jgi:hypothetical protein